MARCIKCNDVYSEFYLKDGVCEDCIEKQKSIINLSINENEEFTKLSKKFKNIDVNKFLEIKDIVESLKKQYNFEITIDDYLTIEILLTPYKEILFKKRNELVTIDDYGNKKYESLNNEIKYFIENTFSQLLKENNININSNFIQNYIFDKINTEGKTYTNNLKNKEAESSFMLFLLGATIIIVLFFFIKSSINSYSSKFISDDQYYDMRMKQEKQQTIRDIQKMVDEAKYQEYKRNH